MDMNRLAYIGDKTTSLLFSAVGIDTYSFSLEDVRENFEHLVNSGRYGIIFVSEEYYKVIEDIIKRCVERSLPSILILPALSGSRGYALEMARDMMRKAAGSDIMEKEQKDKGL